MENRPFADDVPSYKNPKIGNFYALVAESEWDPYKRVENDASHTAEVGFPKRGASKLGSYLRENMAMAKNPHFWIFWRLVFGICLDIFMHDV